MIAMITMITMIAIIVVQKTGMYYKTYIIINLAIKIVITELGTIQVM